MASLSLSARRAWIEIIDDLEPSSTRKVALRKESVDRNMSEDVSYSIIVKSLSARRAWIEIFITQIKIVTGCVALRKESVDRNLTSTIIKQENNGRSPQGERG